MENQPQPDSSSYDETQGDEVTRDDSTEVEGPIRKTPEEYRRSIEERIREIDSLVARSDDLNELLELENRRIGLEAELALWNRPIEPED